MSRLTAVLPSGALYSLTQAIEAEAEAFLAMMKAERVVGQGHGPERPVQTGIGPVAERQMV